MATALAEVADVEAILGRAIPSEAVSRVQRLIDLAGGVFRREAGQTISAVAGDVVTLPGTLLEELWLPERPVTALASVTVDGTTVVSSAYQWSSGGRIYRPLWGPSSAGSPRPRDYGPWGGTDSLIVVTYDHGYDPVPDDVVFVVAEMVASKVTNPEQLRSESVEDYSVTYGSGPGGWLTPAHKEVAAAYRPPLLSIPITTGSDW